MDSSICPDIIAVHSPNFFFYFYFFLYKGTPESSFYASLLSFLFEAIKIKFE